MIILEIPEATPSLNRMLGEHWAKKSAKRKHWAWLVRAARLEAREFPAEPMQRARLTITRHGRRICDRDNLIGGTKILTDCLVREGFFVDDSPAHLETIVNQALTKNPRTTVWIEALSP